MVARGELSDALEEAILLGVFKKFCEMHKSYDSQQKLRNIYGKTPDKISTTKQIIKREQHNDMTEKDAERLAELIMAFLRKKSYRINITDNIKNQLLIKQNNKCAVCGVDVDLHAHADHIVPFKYVGDELKDNLQMLCSECNQEKNASIDFQIKYLLNLTRRN